MKNRRGVSLAELLVLLTFVTIILGIGTRLIHRTMHAQTRATEFFNAERSALRLSTLFRRDSAAAEDAIVSGPAEERILTLRCADDRVIEYRAEPRQVHRTVKQADAVQARETFRFPSDITVQYEQFDAPKRLVLSVESQAPSSGDPGKLQPSAYFRTPLSLRVEACIARDSRLAGTPARREVTQ